MNTPLAHRLRPTKLAEIIGQEHLVGENQIIRNMIEKETLWLPKPDYYYCHYLCSQRNNCCEYKP